MNKLLLTFLTTLNCLVVFSQLNLSGRILDVFNNDPLSRAVITINGFEHTLYSDENGYFDVALNESGVYDLKVSKSGYNSIEESLILNESIELQIMLKFNGSRKSPNLETDQIQVSDQNIAQNINSSPSLDIKDQTNSELSNNRIKKKKKEIVNKLSISGVVRDKFNKMPLPNVKVSIKSLDRNFTTGVDGKFFLQVPRRDIYIVQVKAQGYKPLVDDVAVFKDADLDIFLTKYDLDSSVYKELSVNAVVISRTRAQETTPTTFTKVDKKELEINNIGKDLPFLLELTPSVVATSDGGNGVGYTSLRIRGSDATRINFTLNGFPVNDAESQGVFLVNTPDLASSIESIQIQRGVGTSTNGAGAFGGSININTNKIRKKAYAEFNNGFGTFSTFKNTIKVGTGELFNNFSIDGRFSHLKTAGYVDRATAKLFAYALTGTYYNKKTLIRLNIFSGFENTYQAWNGIDYRTLQTNRTFNSGGTDFGAIDTPYDNEVDNYRQDNYQLSFSHDFGKHVNANLGFHYTKGAGYFEQFKVDQDLADYGFSNVTENTNLVRRRWLDNDFYGSIFSLNYKNKNINTTFGGGWNQYDGDHFGEIIWADQAQEISKDEVYYFNNALKTDFNLFVKAEYKVWKHLILFADLQYRTIGYSADGIDNDQRVLFEDADFNFFNPKAGFSIPLGKRLRSLIYASYARANREPTRNDFIDNETEPLAEQLTDLELGFKHRSDKLSYQLNAFYMKYKNQLVLTGALNDVGSAVRANVDNSYRTGIEAEIAYEHSKYFGFIGSGAVSLNEIESFTFTNFLGQEEFHDNTKIAYSPWLVGNFTLYSKPFKGFEIALINKYVSEQFLDNTNSKAKILNPYYLNDARVSYTFKPKFMREIQLLFKANNILNVQYSSNGYVYFDTPFFYPQAGTNFEGAINLKF